MDNKKGTIFINSFLFTWLIIASIDFLVTLVGIFYLHHSEGEIFLAHIIDNYGIVGYFSISTIYLLLILHFSKNYQKPFILCSVFFIFNHWYGVFTWIYAFTNIYTLYGIDSVLYQYSLSVPLVILIGVNWILIKFKTYSRGGEIDIN